VSDDDTILPTYSPQPVPRRLWLAEVKRLRRAERRLRNEGRAATFAERIVADIERSVVGEGA
jgi:hypothetical protein